MCQQQYYANYTYQFFKKNYIPHNVHSPHTSYKKAALKQKNVPSLKGLLRLQFGEADRN